MKRFFLLPLFFALSCNCTKNTISDVTKFQKTSLESTCPEDGVCTLELLKNKRIATATDVTGKMYFTLEESSETSVIKYEYKRKTDPDLQDGQHREEIVFEIENSVKDLKLIGKELQEVKMIFGRHCFCRGQAGYFKVNQGNLNLTRTNETLKFVLDFKVDQVPQTISVISGNLK